MSVLYSVADGVATLTLNRPESRNALNLAMCDVARGKAANFRIPRYLRIVEAFEAIGMTASGKVQKAKLREHAMREFGL